MHVLSASKLGSLLRMQECFVLLPLLHKSAVIVTETDFTFLRYIYTSSTDIRIFIYDSNKEVKTHEIALKCKEDEYKKVTKAYISTRLANSFPWK
jgi:hypothetical protein